MTLIEGDCLVQMKKLKDDSIDLLFCDLPYGATSCKWDCEIDLSQFWKEVNRICKDTTPMFFTCSTKFGVTLINSNPKNFRYDMVWVKSTACGFLNAKKMPMRKHEMLYVFYRKLPFYDISSHTHKFLNEEKVTREESSSLYGTETGKVFIYDENGKLRNSEPRYDPPLPATVLRETDDTECYDGAITYNYKNRNGPVYEPQLPDSLLDIPSQRGKHPTQKPVALIEWCLKYFSKEGDMVLDPTAGSGSTAVACRNLNRKYICIEKDPEIFKVMEKRLI